MRRYQPIPIAPQGIPSTDEAKEKYVQLDGVPGTQTSRFLFSYTTAIEATALFVQQLVKGAIIADLYHVTPRHGENGCYTG